MAGKCTICGHKRRTEIDAALLAPGGSKRSIAARFKVSATAVQRHKRHVRAVIQEARETGEAITREALLERVADLERRARRFLELAEAAGSARDGLPAIREARSCIELLAKMTGDLQQDGQTVNLFLSPAWAQVITRINSIMPAFPPPARQALADALLELETGRT